jgi:hypothetical protein
MASKEAENSSPIPGEPQGLGGSREDTMGLSDTKESDEHLSESKSTNDSNKSYASSKGLVDQIFIDLYKRLNSKVASSQFPLQSDVHSFLIAKCLEAINAREDMSDTLEGHLLTELLVRYTTGVVEDASRRRIKILQLLLEVKEFIAITPEDRVKHLRRPGDINSASARKIGRWNFGGEIDPAGEGGARIMEEFWPVESSPILSLARTLWKYGCWNSSPEA